MLAENQLGVKAHFIPVEVGQILRHLLAIHHQRLLGSLLVHVVIGLGDFVNHALGHRIHLLHLIVQVLARDSNQRHSESLTISISRVHSFRPGIWNVYMAIDEQKGNEITGIVVRGAGDGLSDGSLLEEIGRDGNDHRIINSFAHISVSGEIFRFESQGKRGNR